jgi:hypothetical protein
MSGTGTRESKKRGRAGRRGASQPANGGGRGGGGEPHGRYWNATDWVLLRSGTSSAARIWLRNSVPHSAPVRELVVDIGEMPRGSQL